MAVKFVNVDRDTPMMFPHDLREWLPEDSMVHFVVDAVEMLDVGCFEVNDRGSGNAQYPPRMMLALLVYCYATGRFSSPRDFKLYKHLLDMISLVFNRGVPPEKALRQAGELRHGG